MKKALMAGFVAFIMVAMAMPAQATVFYNQNSGWYVCGWIDIDGSGDFNVGDIVVTSKWHDMVVGGPESGALVFHSNNIMKFYEVTEGNNGLALKLDATIPHVSCWYGYLYYDYHVVFPGWMF